MTQKEVVVVINKSISEDRHVKLFLKLRGVVVGKFVAMKDNADLQQKGMIRFVSGAKMDLFEMTCTSNPDNVYFTRIILIKDIQDALFIPKLLSNG